MAAVRPAAPAAGGASYEDPKPDPDAAELHLRRTSPTLPPEEGGERYRWRSVWHTKLDEMTEIGGPGTEAYFRLLRNLGMCFVYMSGITSPIVAFSLAGNFAPDTGQQLVQTTIGNLGWLPRSGLAFPLRYVVLGCQGLPLTQLTAYFGWLNFAAVLCFMAFVAVFRFRHAGDDDGDPEHTTAGDFAVEVDCLPSNIEEQTEYKNLLTQHLNSRLQVTREKRKSQVNSAPSEVCELELVRDFGGQLQAIKGHAKLKQDRKVLQEKMEMGSPEKYEKELAKLDKKIEKSAAKTQLVQPEDVRALPVLRAYAVLNTTQDVKTLLFDYRFASFSLLRCCQSRERRFQGKAIRVQPAPEPTNIIWEYQDVPTWKRILRKSVMLVFSIALILLSLGLIYATSTGAKGQTSTSLTFLGDITCDPVSKSSADGGPTYVCLALAARNWTAAYALQQGGEALDCWCSSQGGHRILQDSVMRDACQGWLFNVARSAAIVGMSSLVVVIINCVVRAVLLAMAYYECPRSISALNSSVMTKLFIAQTLNTGFIITLVNYHAPQAIRTLSLALPFHQFILRGDFDDFTRGWYGVVGATLMNNMMVNIFAPTATFLGTWLFSVACRRYFKNRATHQAELLAWYTNADFDISGRYAMLLTTVFCTMIYSPGMPVLNLFAALYCGVMYWGDKLVLLRGSARLPTYDTQMPRQASHFMLWAVPLHCAFAIAMQGQPCSFPSLPLGGKLGAWSDQAQDSSTGASSAFFALLGERISRESTWMVFAMLVAFGLFYASWTALWVLGGTFGELWRFIMLSCCPKRAQDRSSDSADGMTWAAAVDYIEEMCPPASYRLDRSSAFAEISEYLDGTGVQLSSAGFEAQKKASPAASPSSRSEQLGDTGRSLASVVPSGEDEAYRESTPEN